MMTIAVEVEVEVVPVLVLVEVEVEVVPVLVLVDVLVLMVMLVCHRVPLGVWARKRESTQLRARVRVARERGFDRVL